MPAPSQSSPFDIPIPEANAKAAVCGVKSREKLFFSLGKDVCRGSERDPETRQTRDKEIIIEDEEVM
jgi:hypothetical protein